VAKIRVAVVCGGRSGEHEISLRSSVAILDGLDRAKYEVQRIFISPEGRWEPGPILPEPGANPGIDVVFPILHGTFGEDGTMQGLLELADLAYVGPGVLASALAMDKDALKRTLRERGIPVVEWATVLRDQRDATPLRERFPYPVFVKPANMGSSVGISKVEGADSLQTALDHAAEFDRKILVERGIAGREFECSVMGNEQPRAAVPCEVLPSRAFYDYEDKYLLDTAKTLLPAPLDAVKTAELQSIAVDAYRAAGCEGMSRVDFLMEKSTGTLYVNEINTIPGFTSISMFPKMWEVAGIPFATLLDELIALALDRQAQRRRTRFKR
jgi:D-alanine-D-alanine ligase